MRIAIEGCLHGELDILYNTVKFIEQQHKTNIDLVICCGDFQAVRNEADLKTMACPPKYKAMQQFWKYYKGQKRAPVLTIVIGGNHEATNHMQEMPYGGWLAENIYYLGYAGVVNFGGIRIGGVSGVFKGYDYNKGHFEHPPYNEDSMRSAYHTRSIDAFRMKQMKLPIDIIVSHDWPQGIYNFGDVDTLIRKKQHFKEQVEPGSRSPLGSPANAEILYHCKPSYWFSAHLHVKWVALVDHDKLENDEDEEEESVNKNRFTRFLALDKALPQRDFLQIIDIPTKEEKPYELTYDAEWLAILKKTNDLFSITPTSIRLPTKGIDSDWDRSASQEDLEIMKADFDFDLRIPRNFQITVDIYDPKDHWKTRPVELLRNPQNTSFCEKMRLVDPFTVFKEGRDPTRPMEKEEETNVWNNPDDILIDDNCEPEKNTDEIDLSDDDDDCFKDHSTTEKPTETAKEESDNDSENDSDDGAPQARSFRLPFLPPPTQKTPTQSENTTSTQASTPTQANTPTQNTTLAENKPTEKGEGTNVKLVEKMESEPIKEIEAIKSTEQKTVKGFKRRNQAIYTKEEDENE